MRRFSLLFVVLAVLAVGCTSSTTVLGEQTTELASVDPTGSLAEPTADPLDNSWLETAPPLETPTPVATVVAAPTTEPEAEDVADDADEDDEDDDATAETEPVPAVEATPQVLTYEAMVADTVEALENAAVVQIVLERSIGPGEQNDYSSTSGIIVDRASGLERALVVLDGVGWDGLSSRNELARLNTNDEYEFIFGPNDVYVSAQPRLASLPAGNSWLQQQIAELESVQIEQFDTTVVTTPTDVLNDLTDLLRLFIEPRRIDDETFVLDVPNSHLLRIAPGSAILSLVALDHVFNENIVPGRFKEKSRVELRFEDGMLAEVEVDLSDIFAELPELGATSAFEGIEISETYRLTFGAEALLAVPAAEEIADPTLFYPERDTVGTCFALDSSLQLVKLGCAEPHRWEVIDTGLFGDAFGAAIPSADELLARVGPTCNARAEELLDISLEETDLIVDVKTPDNASWEAGDRQYACWISFSQDVEGRVQDLDLTPFLGKVKRFSLETGHCLRDEGLGQAYFTVVDCEEPHFYEVYLRFPVTAETGDFPGEEVVLEEADSRCVSVVEAQLTRNDVPLDWRVHALVPNPFTWDEYNDRFVICLATTQEMATGRRFG